MNTTDAVVKLLGIALQQQPRPWSPATEYQSHPEPGQGYDQTKASWIPEVRSYRDKVLARNAEPVDPAISTTHMGHSIVECEVLTGT